MAPKTRSATSSPVKKTAEVIIIPDEVRHQPMTVLIAPQHITNDARILLLKHPSDAVARQFLFCSKSGLHEIKKTKVPSMDPRSVIFAPKDYRESNTYASVESQKNSFSEGYLNQDAEILTATPYDLSFVLLRWIAPEKTCAKKALFQPLEDLLDSPESHDTSLKYILKNGKHLIQESMSRICDQVQAGDETMYRYNEEKVLRMIFDKAQHVADLGLPDSLEDRFVTRVLEAPMLSVKRESTTASIAPCQSTTTEDSASQDENLDSQSTTTSTAVSVVFSEVSTTNTVVTLPEDDIPAEVKKLQRIRTAYNFIAATCLPPFITTRLSALLSDGELPIDFQPLNDYIKHLAMLRAEAAATRSMSDFSRKRNFDSEEAIEERAEKKRRQEEEEKRKKANESRGVRDLKKVDVSGMKKMSHFFAKKPVAAKAKT